MMDWEDVKIQLIDTPPITADFMEGYLSSMVRSADAALLMVDLADDDAPFTAQATLDRLGAGQDGPHRTQSRRDRGPHHRVRPHDPRGQQERCGRARPTGSTSSARCSVSRFPILVIGRRTRQWAGGIPHGRLPVPERHSRLHQDARQAGRHDIPLYRSGREYASRTGHARPSRFRGEAEVGRVSGGTGVFDGQSVTRDHVLHDKDVVELHA